MKRNKFSFGFKKPLHKMGLQSLNNLTMTGCKQKSNYFSDLFTSLNVYQLSHFILISHIEIKYTD